MRAAVDGDATAGDGQVIPPRFRVPAAAGRGVAKEGPRRDDLTNQPT